MDLIDKIKELAVRIPKQLEYIQTEEATKNAFIMPFISALGYDISAASLPGTLLMLRLSSARIMKF